MIQVVFKQYPVLCAWCLKAGRETIVNWSPVAHSHGICPEHQDALRREIAEIKAKGAYQVHLTA